jgi:hypothetical protein
MIENMLLLNPLITSAYSQMIEKMELEKFYLADLFYFFSGLQEDLYDLDSIQKNDFGEEIKFLTIKSFDFVKDGYLNENEWLNFLKHSKISSNKKPKEKVRIEIARKKYLEKRDFLFSLKGNPRCWSFRNFEKGLKNAYRFLANNQFIVARPILNEKLGFIPDLEYLDKLVLSPIVSNYLKIKFDERILQKQKESAKEMIFKEDVKYEVMNKNISQINSTSISELEKVQIRIPKTKEDQQKCLNYLNELEHIYQEAKTRLETDQFVINWHLNITK